MAFSTARGSVWGTSGSATRATFGPSGSVSTNGIIVASSGRRVLKDRSRSTWSQPVIRLLSSRSLPGTTAVFVGRPCGLLQT